MRSFLIKSLLAVVAAAAVVPEVHPNVASYDGFKVLRVKTRGHRLASAREKLMSLVHDTWDEGPAGLDLVVSPEQFAAIESLGLDLRVMHHNLGQSIGVETEKSPWKRDLAEDDGWYDSYHPYDEHLEYIDNLQKAFPENSEIVSSGTSYEGRDIVGIHLWGKEGPGKPAVLYHATVHAREWIASKVVEYLTYQLITGYNAGDNVTQAVVDSYDFWIFPVVNPDGFVYSQTTERLWRKNRQPAPPPPANQSCFGRDINRNWEFGWDANPLGASTDPCSLVYKGEAPTDTPENAGLDKLMRELRDSAGIKLFIDWHSYGQYILSPYGYNETLYAPELGKWTKAASQVSETIRDSSDARTTFTFGPSGATLYTTTGSAPDHVYEIGGAEFSYTIELRDTGDFGFVLPPEQIRPSVLEQWEGQKVLLSLLDEVFFDGEGPAIFV